MKTQHPPVLMRHDTFLGVCEALGQDFGFHPNYLRVMLSAAVLFNPIVAIASYCGAGLVVAASRYAFPPRKANETTATPAVEAAPIQGVNDQAIVELAKAA